MEAFAIKLGNIPDSYYDFVVAVLTYVKKKDERFKTVNQYIDEHPKVLTSDILAFISEQEDFYEDAAYPQAKAVYTE